MDDFGSIIYIVLTIVAVVFSIIKKSNSSKEAKTLSAESTDSFDEMLPSFGDLFESKKNVEENDNVVMDSSKTSVPRKVEFVPVMNEFQKRVRKSESIVSRVSSLKSTSLVESKESSEEMKSWFNARDAIIYSEILKRPEF